MKKKSKISPTLKDIAQELGLSAMTISQILRGKGQFTEETKTRVLQTVQKLGYRPYAQARSIRTGQTNTIAFLFGSRSEGSHFDKQILIGAEYTLRNYQFQLLLSMCDPEELVSHEYIPSIFLQVLADGVLINYHFDPPSELETILQTQRLPAVWLNRYTSHNAVYFDDYAAGKMGVEYLANKGHRNIIYLEKVTSFDSREHYSIPHRREGYLNGMRAYGLTPRLGRVNIQRDFYSFPDLLQDATGIITGQIDPEQIIAMLAWHRIRVPEDVTIVWIGHYPVFSFPPIIVIRLDWEKIGEQAAELLIQRIRQQGESLPSIVIQPTLCELKG